VGRRLLTFSDRVEIAAALKAGHGVRQIARDLGRSPSVVYREVRRNRTRSRGYRPVAADCAAQRRRRRPQGRKVAVTRCWPRGWPQT
jgi:IS30 family transposase